jgi:hypothetical protein
LIDTKLKKEWFVVAQPGLVECFTGADNHSLPHPDFTMARFVGKAEIDYRVVDHWVQRGADGRDVIQVFDRADNGEIKRIDVDARVARRDHAVSLHFHEYNAGAQDPSLFVLPPEIVTICNNVKK